ncbi:hypothetical protein SAMN02745194_00392 [Roseomonas rosea]|jgi:hypothetical protein|uniref:Uncharacterized protein n=1 Tax=Muricoccus roseus TaxID=198092 RepID=A0A1M6B7K7_9PROT|nr:hypothetical protein SAMN02745194_00392 [Roseomonas rosea]
MLVVSAMILGGLIAAQIATRFAQDRFMTLQGLPRLPQEG